MHDGFSTTFSNLKNIPTCVLHIKKTFCPLKYIRTTHFLCHLSCQNISVACRFSFLHWCLQGKYYDVYKWYRSIWHNGSNTCPTLSLSREQPLALYQRARHCFTSRDYYIYIYIIYIYNIYIYIYTILSTSL